jgi:type I restriction enzyme S subunit
MTAAVVSLADALRAEGGLLQTGPFGSQLKQSEYSAEGIPVIMPKDIHNGTVVTDTVARVPEATAQRLARHKVAVNGIVLPRRGEVTKRAFIGEQQAGWLCGTGCLKIEAQGRMIWPRFLYYYLGTPASIEWLERNAVGSTMLNLSAEIVGRFPLRLRPIGEQKAIAEALSAYDELIENNEKRIALLEEAARLLYREWFVYFRFPGHEHHKLVDGIPHGWNIVLLRDLCMPRDGIQTGPFGSQLHQSDYTEVGVPVVMPKDIQGFRIEPEGIARIPEHIADRLGRHRMQLGDTVYGRRGDIGRRAFIGRRQARWLCGTGCLRIRPDPTKIVPRYLFETLGSQQTAGFIANQAKGSTMPNLSAGALQKVPILFPAVHLQQLFAEEIEPTAELSELLTDQNRKLAEARDLLLPRLMNGKIVV